MVNPALPPPTTTILCLRPLSVIGEEPTTEANDRAGWKVCVLAKLATRLPYDLGAIIRGTILELW